jgi:hypothetical protein
LHDSYEIVLLLELWRWDTSVPWPSSARLLMASWPRQVRARQRCCECPLSWTYLAWRAAKR